MGLFCSFNTVSLLFVEFLILKKANCVSLYGIMKVHALRRLHMFHVCVSMGILVFFELVHTYFVKHPKIHDHQSTKVFVCIFLKKCYLHECGQC